MNFFLILLYKFNKIYQRNVIRQIGMASDLYFSTVPISLSDNLHSALLYLNKSSSKALHRIETLA